MRNRNLFVSEFIFISLVVVVSLVLLVCSKADAVETLNLGATVPFQSRVGIDLKNVLLMNSDLLNKAGGLTVGGKTYMIKYHIYDDKYDPDVARTLIQKLVFEDKIKFNVGTFGSAPVLAMLPVTEPNKIPIFSGAASEKLLSPKVKYFMHCQAFKIGIAIAKNFHELRPDAKTAVLCSYDDETGRAINPESERAYKTFGINSVGLLYFKRGETDFSRIATKVVSLRPDHFGGEGIMFAAEWVQLIKALREAGYKGTISAGYITQEIVDSIVAKMGKEGVEGVEGIYLTIRDPTHPTIKGKLPEAMEFRKNYETYYGKWETDGLLWGGCWYTWLAAVKKANSIDPDKVMAAIDKDLVVSTPLGPAKFFRRPDLGNNRYCDYATVTRFGIVKDGKVVYLTERDADYMIKATEEVYKVELR
jgi:ABC-type branched-subunit amino acid transport system substrate-binding protein